jgi:hypothetical protein
LEEVEELLQIQALKEQMEALVLLQVHNLQYKQLVEEVEVLKILDLQDQVVQEVDLVLNLIIQEQGDQVLLVKEIMVVMEWEIMLVLSGQRVEVEKATQVKQGNQVLEMVMVGKG